MRPITYKGLVYDIVGDIGDKQFPVNGSLVILGTNGSSTLALTSDENIILFASELLMNTDVFELAGSFTSGEVEAVFKPLIRRMRNREYDVALFPLG